MQEIIDKIIERLENCKYKEVNNLFALAKNSGFNEAIEIIKDVVDEYNNGWIPCSERLPSKDGFYNVTVKFWHLNKPTVMSSHFENEQWTCVAIDPADEVIAWQPLPKPYQSKGE